MDRGPDFNPFDALGVADPRSSIVTKQYLITKCYRRAVRHVFGDRPGTPGLAFPTLAQVNLARDYFAAGQLERLRAEWTSTHRSTWNPWAPLNSEAARLPIPDAYTPETRPSPPPGRGRPRQRNDDEGRAGNFYRAPSLPLEDPHPFWLGFHPEQYVWPRRSPWARYKPRRRTPDRYRSTYHPAFTGGVGPSWGKLYRGGRHWDDYHRAWRVLRGELGGQPPPPISELFDRDNDEDELFLYTMHITIETRDISESILSGWPAGQAVIWFARLKGITLWLAWRCLMLTRFDLMRADRLYETEIPRWRSKWTRDGTLTEADWRRDWDKEERERERARKASRQRAEDEESIYDEPMYDAMDENEDEDEDAQMYDDEYEDGEEDEDQPMVDEEEPMGEDEEEQDDGDAMDID